LRLDLWLWLAGGVLALIAGLLRGLPRTAANPHRARLRSPVLLAGWGIWTPLVLTCLGLAFLVAGLAWRLWASGAWPGSTSADGVAMLAGGTLAILSGILLTEARRIKAAESRDVGGVSGEQVGLDRGHAVAEALALFGSCLLILLAIGAAWGTPFPEPSPQVRSCLFGVRVIAASLGLGAWLPAFADAAWGLRPGGGPSRPETTGLTPGLAAMRAGFPWLTAAWLLGAAWSLAAVAALWRGLPAEAWLVVAWLLGGIYLAAAWGARPARLPQWALVLLTACGATAALLQAWQTPLLLL
jgi:hypothetical protein